MLEDHRGSDDLASAEEIPPAEANRMIHGHLDRHYRTLSTDKIPALDDKTPRQAAQSKSGRAKMINWLKYIENAEMRRARERSQTPYDFGWMWEELGVSHLRK